MTGGYREIINKIARVMAECDRYDSETVEAALNDYTRKYQRAFDDLKRWRAEGDESRAAQDIAAKWGLHALSSELIEELVIMLKALVKKLSERLEEIKTESGFLKGVK